MSGAIGRAAVLVLVAAWLQGTWLQQLAVGGEWPDLVLVCVVLTVLLCGGEAGLAAGVTAGLAMGWLAGQAGAAFFVSRLVLVPVISPLRQRWHRDNALVQALAVVVGALVAETVFLLLQPRLLGTPEVWRRVVGRAVYDILLVPLVAWPVSRWPAEEES